MILNACTDTKGANQPCMRAVCSALVCTYRVKYAFKVLELLSSQHPNMDL